jgi:pimeloyl-ACP methyl ester carboxylesterase
MSSFRFPALTTTFVLLFAIGQAQTTAPFTGAWAGNIMGIKLIFHFTVSAAGQPQGTLDSPMQGDFDHPFDAVSVQTDSLTCVLKSPAARYAGVRTGDSTCWGTWYQGGRSFPLTLHRLSAAETRALLKPGRPQTPKPPFPYQSDSVEYDNADKTVHLAATLTYPDKGGPFPAAILITGSGIQDRDETLFGHHPFAVIADYLTRQGYAVLRVDDRTAGLSTGDTYAATSADFAKDVETSFAWLKTRKNIDPKKIGLIGHSEGAMIAPMVAAENKDVAFIISLAGPLNGYSTLLYQVLTPLQRSHVNEQVIAFELAKERMLLNNIKNAADSAGFMQGMDSDYRAYYASIPDSLRPQYNFVPRPDQYLHALAPLAHSTIAPWWKFLVGYQAGTYYSKVGCPVLLLGGDKDFQVPNATDMTVITSILKDHHNTKVETHLLPGLNHLFQHCHTCLLQEYGELEETFSPEVLSVMATWLDKNVR